MAIIPYPQPGRSKPLKKGDESKVPLGSNTRSRWNAAVRTYRQWQHAEDLGVLAFTAGVFLANHYDADPVWSITVGGPGGGKTELLRALDGLDDVYLRSTITEAGLLSGVPKKDRSDTASGGLLRQIGFDLGFIVLKDFGSILSINRHMRPAILQAFRDIYDGYWSRQVGADGGMLLEWKGKIGLMSAATGAVDSHHTALAALGERFLYFRLPQSNGEARMAQSKSAIQHVGRAREMRESLHQMMVKLFCPLPDLPDIHSFPAHDIKSLAALGDVAALARSVVERDYYSTGKDIVDVPDPEHGTRLSQALVLLLGGMRAVGVPDSQAWRVLRKAAFDSIPPLRRAILDTLSSNGPTEQTRFVAKASRNVVQRCLEDLGMLGLVQGRAKVKGEDAKVWSLTSFAKQRYEEAGF